MPFSFSYTLQFFPSYNEVLSSGMQCLLASLGGRAILGLHEVVAGCNFRDCFLSVQRAPSTKERLTILASPVGAAKMVKGQKYVICEKRWRMLDLFSVATRRWKGKSAAFCCLKWDYRDRRDTAKGKRQWHKLQQGKCLLSIQTFTVSVGQTWDKGPEIW